ncbi:hypothetical protein M9H77_02416 [Catharanthus roseus]|uniref:Uncharacterized protein n=1 Tax=Catharanthus roseus TaxID=4058 RepID=A0ACC0C8G5_CATRO|nr:hypothetical protein M9H77_02416 [Catharanthus roseus]
MEYNVVNAYGGNNHGNGNFTPKTNIRVGNFSRHAHNFYDCYGGNRVGAKNYYNDRTYERAPRNKVRNGENYVKMDEMFHKRRGNVERCHDSHKHYEHSHGLKPIKTWSLMKQALRIRYGVENHKGQGQGQTKVKFMEPSIVEEAPNVKELPHAAIEAKEVVEIHVEKEASNEYSCDSTNEKSIKKESARKREISRKIMQL